MLAYARRFGVTSAMLCAFMLALTAAVAAPARTASTAGAPEGPSLGDRVLGTGD